MVIGIIGYDCVLIKKMVLWRHTQEGKMLGEVGGWRPGSIENSQRHQELRERHGQILPWSLPESMVLQTPWVWSSLLQNYKRTHFSCFNPAGLWCFVIAALRNWYTPTCKYHFNLLKRGSRPWQLRAWALVSSSPGFHSFLRWAMWLG